MPTTILDSESYLEALQRRYVEESKNEDNMKLIQMAEEACAPSSWAFQRLLPVFLRREAPTVSRRGQNARSWRPTRYPQLSSLPDFVHAVNADSDGYPSQGDWREPETERMNPHRPTSLSARGTAFVPV